MLREIAATAVVWRPYIVSGYVIALGTLGLYAASIVSRTRRVSRRLAAFTPPVDAPPPERDTSAPADDEAANGVRA